MGASTPPFRDLSFSSDANPSITDRFRVSKSITPLLLLLLFFFFFFSPSLAHQNKQSIPTKPSQVQQPIKNHTPISSNLLQE
jgi:hypothetical protein